MKAVGHATFLRQHLHWPFDTELLCGDMVNRVLKTAHAYTPVGMEEERVDVNGKCTSTAAARKFLIGTREIAFCERFISHARRTLNNPEDLTGLVLRAER